MKTFICAFAHELGTALIILALLAFLFLGTGCTYISVRQSDGARAVYFSTKNLQVEGLVMGPVSVKNIDADASSPAKAEGKVLSDVAKVAAPLLLVP